MHKRGITRCWVRGRPPTQTPLSMQDGGYGRRGPFPTGVISRIPHNRGRRRGRRTRIGRRHRGQSGRRHSGKGGGLRGNMQHSRGTHQEPWAKPRRQMRRQQRRPPRRQGRKNQQTFVPPDARPKVTPSPAAANSPAPAASQLQITPPGPPTPSRTAEVFRWLQAEGIDASPKKRQKGSPRTPERKRKAAEQQEGSSPKKQKLTVWKPKLPQAETSKWPRMYTPLSQILYTPEHAVKNGVVAQDIGVRLCPSSLPKRGVSRNHSGSQLCS